MENLLLFFGRLHPLVVHLPIGILLLLALLELAGRWSRFPRLGEAQRTAVLACGAAAAVMAAGLGWLLAERGDFSGTLLDRHRLLGFLTAGGAIALLVVQGLRWQRVYAPLLALTVGLPLASTPSALLERVATTGRVMAGLPVSVSGARRANWPSRASCLA